MDNRNFENMNTSFFEEELREIGIFQKVKATEWCSTPYCTVESGIDIAGRCIDCVEAYEEEEAYYNKRAIEEEERMERENKKLVWRQDWNGDWRQVEVKK